MTNPYDIVEDDSGNVGDDPSGLAEDEDDDDDEKGDCHVTLAMFGRDLSTDFTIQSVIKSVWSIINDVTFIVRFFSTSLFYDSS